MPPQQASPTKGVVKKGKVPVSTALPMIKLPKAAEADLPNGLHLLVLEDHRLPQISFTIYLPGAGGYYDPADQPGLATFTAGLMREGTATRTSEQISQQLEVMAATLNVGATVSGPEATIGGSCLTEQFDKLLDLASDVLLHPTFPDEEIARYKQRLRTQLVQQRTIPGFLAQEMFQGAVYGTHPASRVSTTIAALDKVTRDAIVENHHAHFTPDHAAFAISGDISLADAQKLVAAKFSGWSKSGSNPAAPSDPEPIGAAKIFLIGRPNSVQTSFVVGEQAIERTNADYDRLQVMNRILGGGPTGRLFIHLREEKGYTYGIGSSVNAPAHRGEWSASTDVRSEVTEAALRDLLAEIAQMRDQLVTDEELADSKRAMIAGFALSLESPAQLLNYAVTRWRYKLPADYYDRYAERVSAVKKDDVEAMAKKYLGTDHMQIVAVGDPAKVADILKKFGVVETYDADGKKIGTP